MAAIKWRNLRILFGYQFILNQNTNEVHDLKNVESRCKTKWMARKNMKFITRSKFDQLKKENARVNGCRFCLPGEDTD